MPAPLRSRSPHDVFLGTPASLLRIPSGALLFFFPFEVPVSKSKTQQKKRVPLLLGGLLRKLVVLGVLDILTGPSALLLYSFSTQSSTTLIAAVRMT